MDLLENNYDSIIYSKILTRYLVVSYLIIFDPFKPLIFSFANSFINIVFSNINNQSRIQLVNNTIQLITLKRKNQIKSSSDSFICIIGLVKFGYSVRI